MNKWIKITISLMLILILCTIGVVNVAAEEESKIYFEVPNSWADFNDIYCYTNIYGNTDSLVDWQTEETKCEKIADGLYAYDILNVCKIENDKYYVLLFSNDKNDTTIDLLFSTASVGDTVYCDENLIEAANDMKYYSAHWRNTSPTLDGDTNLDRSVNIKDATYIQKYLAKIELRSVHWENILDINGDGKVSISDATQLQKKLAKINVESPESDTTVSVISPTAYESVKINDNATGDEIAFSQTEYIEYDLSTESSKYYQGKPFFVFTSNHFSLYDLCDTELSNKYNDEYFEDNALIIMLHRTSSSKKFRVDSVVMSDGQMGVNYTMLLPESGVVNADLADSRVYIEISKSDIIGLKNIVEYQNTEMY